MTCGLCCNGVIFADVRLQPGDEPAKLHRLGMPLAVSRRNGSTVYGSAGDQPARVRQCRFSQPCAAFDGCRCQVYADRPKHCRGFECGVLKCLQSGRIKSGAARRLIRTARANAGRVRLLLRQFGDRDESFPLAARFRNTSRRLEGMALEPALAHLYGELTLAVHDLNFLLSEAFYPGNRADEL